jgi:8-oxo-dGTP pyrophosphatase MutT (NUDIX family)
MTITEKEIIKQLLKSREKKTNDRKDLKPAAVLIPLFEKNGKTHILLTKRTDLVEHHKHQICFPGGSFNYEDLDCMTTALRETEEEIGLAMDEIEILGELDHIVTVSHFRVCPYIGVIPYPYPFSLSTREVARLIELPLDFIREESELREGPFNFHGQMYLNLHVDYRGDIIWGATARILKNFLNVLNGSIPSKGLMEKGNGLCISTH